MKYYVASCYFTAHYPELSAKVLEYISRFSDIMPVRCCIPNYRVKENSERIPDALVRKSWDSLPPSADFKAGDTVYSVCHNCTNILDEQHDGLILRSLWEFVAEDESFVLPKYGMSVSLQDCWRSCDRADEQAAVRTLLKRMDIEFDETPPSGPECDFCGSTLYRPQPEKNSKYAPKHYVEQAEGKFLPHTAEEQVEIMKDYCRRYTHDTVVCYCHYCLEGIKQGGKDGRHIAELVFGENK